MVRDYFSVFSRDNEAFLLRIHQKVDFADEVAWAHCWFCNKDSFLKVAAPLICNYLIFGFDIIEKWREMDAEGWHADIRHFGFQKMLIEMELVPDIIYQTNKLSLEIERKLTEEYNNQREVEIPTFVGQLSKALDNIGLIAPKPRVADAIINIPLSTVLAKNWQSLPSIIEAFC